MFKLIKDFPKYEINSDKFKHFRENSNDQSKDVGPSGPKWGEPKQVML